MNANNKVSQISILTNIGFVLKYLFRLNKKLYVFRLPLILLNILSPILNTYLLAYLINELTTETSLMTVVLFALLIAGVNLILSLLRRVLVKCDQCEKERTVMSIKLHLGKNVSELPFSDVEQPRIRDFISLAQDTTLFPRVIDATTSLVGAVIAVVTYSTILMSIQPWLIAVIVVNIIVQLLIGRVKLKDNDKWRSVQEPIFRKLWYYEGLLCDPRYGKELRVNLLQEWIFGKVNSVYEDECAPIVKTNAKNINLLDLVAQTVKIAEKIFIYFFLVFKVIFGGMLIGDFTFYLSNTTNFSNALTDLTNSVLELNECGTFIREFRFFDSLCKKRASVFGNQKHEGNDYTIEFRNVSFRYPNTEHYVLNDISFKINRGEKLSLVGINGSGKTTLVKLLCRFYEPTEGNIYIGGVNIREYSPSEYNKLLGVVFQDFKLFSFSVKENITMSEQDDPAGVEDCITQCGLKEKVEGFCQETDTFVYKDFDENGIEFSGGEGQKLAIARALYKNAPVMILDEPTASLDPIAEYEIFKRIHHVTQGKTAIFISHRLSSTQFTDKIAVFQNGSLAEFGCHTDLMEIEDGVYRNMFSMQQKYYL